MSSSIQKNKSLYSITEGEGAPVILLHGLGGSLNEWSSASEALASAGYQTFRVDLPGHGSSDKPSEVEDYQSSSVYRRIESWYLDLAFSDKAILIGHSFGGYLAANLALKFPDSFQSLVLVSPFICTHQLLPIMKITTRRPSVASRILELTPSAALEKVVQFLSAVNNHLPNGAVHQTAADLTMASPKIVHTAPSIDDLRPLMSKIDLPTLLVWGGRDLTLNPDEFPKLQRTMPNSIGAAFDQSGHAPHLSEASEFQELLLKFIES